MEIYKNKLIPAYFHDFLWESWYVEDNALSEPLKAAENKTISVYNNWCFNKLEGAPHKKCERCYCSITAPLPQTTKNKDRKERQEEECIVREAGRKLLKRCTTTMTWNFTSNIGLMPKELSFSLFLLLQFPLNNTHGQHNLP